MLLLFQQEQFVCGGKMRRFKLNEEDARGQISSIKCNAVFTCGEIFVGKSAHKSTNDVNHRDGEWRGRRKRKRYGCGCIEGIWVRGK